MSYGGVADGIRDVLFGTGVIQAIRELLPAPFVEAAGPITHLGDGALLVGIAVSLYWLRHDRRREYAYVIAVGLGAFALVTGLKALFVHPRPPTSVQLVAESNYGFPSAHALGSTVVFGSLAYVSRLGTPRKRYLVAAALIGTVSLSRVVLGVHFLGDALGGIAIGLAYLALMIRYADRDPASAFAVALGLAVLAAVVAPNQYTTATLGGSIGALVGWHLVRERAVSPSVLSIGVVLAVAVPATLAVRELVGSANVLLETAGFALVVAGTLLVPAIAAELDSATGLGDRFARVERSRQ